ncbi:MAG TPA: 2-oxoglutarate dehydrogenase E1 component [Gammaproteobacteria bacterium]|nr:2-oxoglutarate dehydrogenase E1 component [Gammaproteobacteria bacterium]
MSTSDMQSLLSDSYLYGGNADYLEELYDLFLKDPQAIDPKWRAYFQRLPNGTDVSHADIRKQFLQLAKQPLQRQIVTGDALHERKQAAVKQLINAYRTYGHLAAKTDPLGKISAHPRQLTLSYYPDLSPKDYDQQFHTQSLLGVDKATLREIIVRLEEIYCGSIGSEFMYISNLEEALWVQQRLEQKRPELSAEQKREILKQLIAADGLEKYLGNKYVAQKRFSLEGGDSFIPFVHAVNEQASQQGVKEILMGMAHRGRLNTLINIYGKPAEELFQEFEGRKDYGLTSGDVKYHLGYASDVETKSGPLHLMLAFNPSHLEVINAVLMGSVRARQERPEREQPFEVMGLLVHGDASFAGQGIVQETLNMSQTNAYQIAGTVHVVINNQVGFTTSDPKDARSSIYCTDPAKMIDCPIFHVNGDDPEAVVFVAQLATEYRNRFHKDVVADIVCYRRQGHNEGDEPIATQPMMYQFIRKYPVTHELYAQKLIDQNVCTAEEVANWIKSYRDLLDTGGSVVKTKPDGLSSKYAANWAPYLDREWFTPVETSVPLQKLVALGEKLAQLPPDFEVQRQVSHTLAARTHMIQGQQPLDWGYAETLAYASLLDEGYSVRISGEDVRRGTFAHRHATLHDQKTGKTYTALAHIAKSPVRFQIYDSLLSEVGTMGFEYGYATTDPHTLVLWEAQYGDFANGAQVVMDQFISSAWQKWRTLCGLTLLLPHGYEGSGPEHTSARLERYLQLCAEKNMQVCVPTTPAQIFHLLRRQIIRPYRTPLIVMTPKSMLRNKLAVSSLAELSQGHFQLVIPETEHTDTKQIKRVILCSGKVYYDLLQKRGELSRKDIALIRIEQLYPFPRDELQAQLKQYENVKDVIWCQEEPENQGAWYIMRHRFEACLAKGQRLHYAGRPAAASPAVGYMKLHLKQQAELINAALGLKEQHAKN